MTARVTLSVLGKSCAFVVAVVLTEYQQSTAPFTRHRFHHFRSKSTPHSMCDNRRFCMNHIIHMKESRIDLPSDARDCHAEASISAATASRKRILGIKRHEDDSSSDSESCDLSQLDILSNNATSEENPHHYSLQKYYYTERERFLPLANITRSLKDAMHYAMPGKNIRVSKEGMELIFFFGRLLTTHQLNNAFKRSPLISSSC